MTQKLATGFTLGRGAKVLKRVCVFPLPLLNYPFNMTTYSHSVGFFLFRLVSP